MSSEPQAAEPPATPRTPASRLLGNAALVFVGGALGALARAALVAAVPFEAASWMTLAINLSGAFVFAWLVTFTLGQHDRVRALFGAGFLGGFTTYSALAFDVAARVVVGDLSGILLAVISVVGGVALALLGWRLGRMTQLRASKSPPAPPAVIP